MSVTGAIQAFGAILAEFGLGRESIEVTVSDRVYFQLMDEVVSQRRSSPLHVPDGMPPVDVWTSVGTVRVRRASVPSPSQAVLLDRLLEGTG